MFEYLICNIADKETFKRQCLALEKNIKELRKDKQLVDVDGSIIQSYFLDDKKVTVYNSFYLNEVYIQSEFDLEKHFV